MKSKTGKLPTGKFEPFIEEYIEPNDDPLVFQLMIKYIDNIDKLTEQEKELFLDILSMWAYPSVRLDTESLDKAIKNLFGEE